MFVKQDLESYPTTLYERQQIRYGERWQKVQAEVAITMPRSESVCWALCLIFTGVILM